jgi:hypothetical protein
VIEFVEECRREWKRLGVPDPISNEMAADLTADIEEAQAEGGSAEDVLGDSLFDPRRFAGAWAGARGVTTRSAPGPVGPSCFPERERSRWYRPVAVLALTAAGLLTALVGAALVVGRHSAAVAAPVSRVLPVPGSIRLFGPGLASPPLRFSVSGPSLAAPLALVAFGLLAVAIIALCLAVFFWSPWFRRGANRRLD